MTELPGQFISIKKRFKKLSRAVENLGKVTRESGPLDEKTAHLIQLAAAGRKVQCIPIREGPWNWMRILTRYIMR
jgi:hypothetical protein